MRTHSGATEPHNHDDVAAAVWHQAVRQALQHGLLSTLEALLQNRPPDISDAEYAYYCGQLWLAHGEYAQAASQFSMAYDSAQREPTADFRIDCAVWLAYCHSLLGHYSLVAALCGTLRTTALCGRHAAHVSFVEGLLASYCGTLAEAQQHFEQARDGALLTNDRLLELRCYLNLAAVYQHQGLMSRVGRSLHQADRLLAEQPDSRRQLQLRNIHVNRLRLLGNPAAALDLALPLPPLSDRAHSHFWGWLALSTALAAVDADAYTLANTLWQQAEHVLRQIDDNDFSRAELLWVRAWLHYRQGQLAAAETTIQTALDLIDDQLDTDYLHAYAIAGIIAVRRQQLGRAEHYLHYACAEFRRVGHVVGLASVLMHLAAFYLEINQPGQVRPVLAEAMTLLHKHQLYGMYYWDPATVAQLCRYAADDAPAVAERTPLTQRRRSRAPQAGADAAPQDWATYAAALAEHWTISANELSAAPIAAGRATAYPGQTSCSSWQPGQMQHGKPAPRSRSQPKVMIYSLGQFRVRVGGIPLTVQAAGTRKALVVFGLLLLAGQTGAQSDDLALFVWPQLEQRARRAALHSTISTLRAAFRPYPGAVQIVSLQRRYILTLDLAANAWWDWAALQAGPCAPGGPAEEQRAAALLVDRPFMDGFFDLLPEPPAELHLRAQWELLYDSLHETIEAHAARAASLIELGAVVTAEQRSTSL